MKNKLLEKYNSKTRQSFQNIAKMVVQFKENLKASKKLRQLRKEDKEIDSDDDFEYNEPVYKYRRDTPYYIQPPPERDYARYITLNLLKKNIVPVWYYQEGVKYQMYKPQYERT